MARPLVRRVALVLIALVITGVCVRLGVWQLDRLQERRAFNARVTTGLAADASPVQEVLGSGPVADLAYRRVTATGTYDNAHEVILYGRTFNERPGNHVLTPLVLADGSAVLVDRGWVPFVANQPLPVPGEAAAPAGTVAVDGFLIPPEDATSPGAEPVTTLQRIDLELLQGQIPERLAPLALQLQTQEPAQAAPLPAPPPELSEGPHLSYAIQWFAFATTAIVGAGLLLRRDRRDERRAVTVRVAPSGAVEASSAEEEEET